RRVLDAQAHRRAVVGAVKQEFLQQRRVPGREPRAHARTVGSLRKAREDNQLFVTGAAELVRRLEGTERRAVEVDLRIALVRGDHEAVAIGELEQALPVL